MTNEEAIKILRANVMVACDTSDKVGYDTPLNKAIEQALEMAIKALEQEPCEYCVRIQTVNELFDSEIKMYKERIETRKGSNYHDETERIKEFRSRIANAEYWQNKIKALLPVTSIYEKLKCTPKEMTHEERVLIELTRDMPKEVGVLYIQSFQQEHGPFTDEAADIIREYLSKE